MAKPVKNAPWREHAQRYEAVTVVDKRRYFLGYYTNEADAVHVINQFKRQAKGAGLERKQQLAVLYRQNAKANNGYERKLLRHQIQELEQRIEALEQRINTEPANG